jgi:hypothetical protein
MVLKENKLSLLFIIKIYYKRINTYVIYIYTLIAINSIKPTYTYNNYNIISIYIYIETDSTASTTTTTTLIIIKYTHLCLNLSL